MLVSRKNAKIVKYLAICGSVTLTFWLYYVHTNSYSADKRASASGLKQNITTYNQLFNNYHHTQKLNVATDQLSNNNELYNMLANLKDSYIQLQQQTENLQHHLQLLHKTQQQKQVNPKNTSVEEFARRRRKVQYLCSTDNVIGQVERVLTHDSGVIYCVVPKAGCTFWKRIFVAASNQTNVTKDSVNTISRETVHSPELSGMPYKSNFNAIQFPTRLIVTRDPYSRLLSSYCDKVYLPDFWETEVVPMIQKQGNISYPRHANDFLRSHFNRMAEVFKNKQTSGTTAGERKCGKYVTFAEFVDMSFDRDEPHWMPIHRICNPCTFNVTHVSTMETFTHDARVVLAKMKLESVLDSLDGNTQVDEEISLISNYNFHHFYREKKIAFYKQCISPKEIAYRLWHNFRWRGYIDPEVEYQIPNLRDAREIQKDFMDQVWSARRSGLQNPQRMKAAKEDFKRKAFASISKSMFERLSKKYDMDFRLFGYTDLRDEMYTLYLNN